VRWLDLAIVALFAAARITLAFQNNQTVGMSFLSLGLTLLLAVVVFIAFGEGADRR
jgi:hypothetical protein